MRIRKGGVRMAKSRLVGVQEGLHSTEETVLARVRKEAESVPHIRVDGVMAGKGGKALVAVTYMDPVHPERSMSFTLDEGETLREKLAAKRAEFAHHEPEPKPAPAPPFADPRRMASGKNGGVGSNVEPFLVNRAGVDKHIK
jgi:hypothetical protein